MGTTPRSGRMQRVAACSARMWDDDHALDELADRLLWPDRPRVRHPLSCRTAVEPGHVARLPPRPTRHRRRPGRGGLADRQRRPTCDRSRPGERASPGPQGGRCKSWPNGSTRPTRCAGPAPTPTPRSAAGRRSWKPRPTQQRPCAHRAGQCRFFGSGSHDRAGFVCTTGGPTVHESPTRREGLGAHPGD